MVCVESPEVWFEDIITVPVTTREQYIAIDPLFCETVIQHTMRVTSVVYDCPATPGAKVIPRNPEQHLSQVFLQTVPVGAVARFPQTVTITVRGIRNGREGQRFKQFTNDQMERNAAFWRSAYE